jgi:hypothetical protein
MKYCPKCRVYFDVTTTKCKLCNGPIEYSKKDLVVTEYGDPENFIMNKCNCNDDDSKCCTEDSCNCAN